VARGGRGLRRRPAARRPRPAGKALDPAGTVGRRAGGVGPAGRRRARRFRAVALSESSPPARPDAPQRCAPRRRGAGSDSGPRWPGGPAAAPAHSAAGTAAAPLPSGCLPVRGGPPPGPRPTCQPFPHPYRCRRQQSSPAPTRVPALSRAQEHGGAACPVTQARAIVTQFVSEFSVSSPGHFGPCCPVCQPGQLFTAGPGSIHKVNATNPAPGTGCEECALPVYKQGGGRQTQPPTNAEGIRNEETRTASGCASANSWSNLIGHIGAPMDRGECGNDRPGVGLPSFAPETAEYPAAGVGSSLVQSRVLSESAPPQKKTQDPIEVSGTLMFTIILNGVLTKSVTKIQHHCPQCRGAKA
jgi:hypothetical protein